MHLFVAGRRAAEFARVVDLLYCTRCHCNICVWVDHLSGVGMGVCVYVGVFMLSVRIHMAAKWPLEFMYVIFI